MKLFRLFIVLFIFSGCAATQIALEKKDLRVETKMSSTIFLDIETQASRTAFIDVRNTSDQDIDIKTLLASKLQPKGYTISATPKEAFYILQCNILYVGKADPSALRESLYAGYGGALGGAVAGGMIGAAIRHGAGLGYGAGIGALAGVTAELIAGSLVKDVTYTIVTDLMVSEQSMENVSQTIEADLNQGSGSKIKQSSNTTVNRKRYQTRIVSTANKVNLDLAEALPQLTDNLSKSIAGIF